MRNGIEVHPSTPAVSRRVQSAGSVEWSLQADSPFGGLAHYGIVGSQTCSRQRNHLDFGARLYDPARGQFTGPDPKAALSRRWSPYSYAYDNPVRFNDPDGMLPRDCPTCPGQNAGQAALAEARKTYQAVSAGYRF